MAVTSPLVALLRAQPEAIGTWEARKPMGHIRSRLALFFNVKSSAALDQLEDPREVLDYAYAEQQTHLRAVRRGLVEVAAARQ